MIDGHSPPAALLNLSTPFTFFKKGEPFDKLRANG
ncbi:hypothetical protein SPHS6_00583 [Sphingobium sp. S6]|nr:hypothetical protein SPHS6_00583 [Sphingobium sp. S6]CAD7335669.1 hypothetical protein SPHS8_00625 [Sphingobium sp. S8]